MLYKSDHLRVLHFRFLSADWKIISSIQQVYSWKSVTDCYLSFYMSKPWSGNRIAVNRKVVRYSVGLISTAVLHSSFHCRKPIVTVTVVRREFEMPFHISLPSSYWWVHSGSRTQVEQKTIHLLFVFDVGTSLCFLAVVIWYTEWFESMLDPRNVCTSGTLKAWLPSITK